MRNISKIVVHNSASEWGDAVEIDKWHLDRGWKGIGYHYVILNGKRESNEIYRLPDDGVIERGREDAEIGAHVRGMNADTLGICLIDTDDFTSEQLNSLQLLLYSLTKKYNLQVKDIIGHYETPSGKAQGKTCPNIDMKRFRMKLYLFFIVYRFSFQKIDIPV